MESHCETVVLSTSWVYILKTFIITISRNRATESRFNLLKNQLTESHKACSLFFPKGQITHILICHRNIVYLQFLKMP